MAKYLRFMLIFLLLSISISNSPLGQSGLVTFFGPVEFVRGTGKPIVEAKDFSAFGFLPPFTLHLRNGDENGNNRVSSAEVWLNELPLFKESDFSQKVAGYDVAVSLNGSNTLKVKLNSKPGSKLAVWIEGNPPELNVTLDEAHRVIAPITSSGGTLSTTGADGTTLILTIPEGALYEEQQISLTPIVSVTGLTLSGGFLRGADLEPDGLRLLKPSTLEITPPTPLSIQNRLVGFVSSGNGKNFHLFPAFFNQTSIMFHLSHFSGYGAGDGTDEEIEATTTATPSSDEEIWAESEIAAVLAECANVYGNCVLTQQQKERIMNAFIYWFEQGIIPELGEAVSCAADLNCDTFQDLFQYMISIRNHWLEDAQLLGLDEDLLIQLMNQRFRSLVETEFEDILYDYAVICSSSTDFCGEQWGIAKRYLLVWTVLQQNGWEISNAPPPEDFCPSFLEKAVHKVKIISPSPIIISVGEKKTLELEIANMFGQKIQEVTGGKIAWESSDPTKASVDPATGIITGVAAGSAEITVTAKQCDQTFTDETQVQVTSQEFTGSGPVSGSFCMYINPNVPPSERITRCGSVSGQITFSIYLGTSTDPSWGSAQTNHSFTVTPWPSGSLTLWWGGFPLTISGNTISYHKVTICPPSIGWGVLGVYSYTFDLSATITEANNGNLSITGTINFQSQWSGLPYEWSTVSFSNLICTPFY